MRAILVAVGLGLLASPAYAADQFDLICKGRHKTSRLGSWKPYELRYRVDLATKAYCAGQCAEARTIADISAAEITFDRQPTPNSAVALQHRVNRTTGEWRYYLASPTGLIQDAEGRCEAAPFSGLPDAKF